MLWNICRWKCISGFTPLHSPHPYSPHSRLHACLRTRYNQNIIKPRKNSMIEAVLLLIRFRGVRESRLQRNNGKGVVCFSGVCDSRGEEINTKDKIHSTSWGESMVIGWAFRNVWQRREQILSDSKLDSSEGRKGKRSQRNPYNRRRKDQRENPGLTPRSPTCLGFPCL